MTRTLRVSRSSALLAIALASCAAATAASLQDGFQSTVSSLKAQKAEFAKRQQDLLAERYDLADRAVKGTTMTRGKAVQEGVRVKLPADATWDSLAAMKPEDVRSKNLWPAGFYPLPHPHHEAGGMVFPTFLIDETKRSTQRDLTRFDLDFDLPQHLLPEFPAPIYLTTRPDLGDVSKGQLVTLANYYELFKDVLNPKQLEGLRLLVTPFPQAQFNATEDRRSLTPHLGVECLELLGLGK
jgi:cytochrome c peroxidase